MKIPIAELVVLAAVWLFGALLTVEISRYQNPMERIHAGFYVYTAQR